MHCICNLYIKKVRGNNINSRLVACFIICILINGCTTKKPKLAAIAGEYSGELQQFKKTKAGSISMLLMLSSADDNAGMDVYRARIILKANQPIKEPAVMQYMNFNISNGFYTVQGSDTMHSIVCERIPGISKNDFLYLVWFKKTKNKANTGQNLRLLIADTVAGFGETMFEVKSETLKKLEQ